MKAAGGKTVVPSLKSKPATALTCLVLLSFLSTPLFADSIEGRLDNLEDQLYELRQSHTTQNGSQADTQARLDQLESELRLLSGNSEAEGGLQQQRESGFT